MGAFVGMLSYARIRLQTKLLTSNFRLYFKQVGTIWPRTVNLTSVIDEAPTYHKGHSIVLGFCCLTWVLVAFNVYVFRPWLLFALIFVSIYCMRENKARSEGRRVSNVEKYRMLWEDGLTRAPIGMATKEHLYANFKKF